MFAPASLCACPSPCRASHKIPPYAVSGAQVLYRLSMLVPEPYLCVERLKDIAAQYEVEWEPSVETLSLPASGLGAGIGWPPSSLPKTKKEYNVTPPIWINPSGSTGPPWWHFGGGDD